MDPKLIAKIENEYISSDINYKKLANKYDVSMRTLSRLGKDRNFVEKRKQFGDKLAARTAEKTAEKTAERESNKLIKLADTADLILSQINKSVSDPEQFQRHVFRGKNEFGSEFIESVLLDKTDSAALRQTVSALKDLTAIIRDVNNLPIASADEGKIEITYKLPDSIDNYGV